MPKHHLTQKTQPTNRVASSIPAQLSRKDTPSYEQIQKKAYEIHEQKGGSDFENWLEAERILKEERAHETR